jgi:hypothetical protein
MSSETGAYAILITPEIQQAQPEKKDLLLPLTLAYLLSEHIRFLFPMPEENSRLVDAAFDELLKGMLLKSNGIEYLKNCNTQQQQDFITSAELILTTDVEVERLAQEYQLPCLVLGRNAQGETSVRTHSINKIKAEELRAQSLGCAQLITVISGGVLSKGHFSLSW